MSEIRRRGSPLVADYGLEPGELPAPETFSSGAFSATEAAPLVAKATSAGTSMLMKTLLGLVAVVFSLVAIGTIGAAAYGSVAGSIGWSRGNDALARLDALCPFGPCNAGEALIWDGTGDCGVCTFVPGAANVTIPAAYKPHCSAVAPSCAAGEHVDYDGTCYSCIANVPITSVGTGVSGVSNGAAYQLKSYLAGSGIVITSGANEDTWAVSSDVMRSCSPTIPTCGAKQFVWSNGTCHTCVTVPSSYVEMCGACVAGQMMVWGPNSTCAVCQAIPTFSTQCVGTGDCAVSTVNGDIKSLLFTEGFQTSSTSTQLRVDLAPHVMRRCNTSCVTGYTPVWNGTSTCFECANVTGSISVGSITNAVEAGLSLIVDGVGPDYTFVVVEFNGEGVSAGIAGGILSVNHTLPATLIRSCSPTPPTCTLTQRLISNGTCAYCIENDAIPATYVQRCGLCSPGDMLIFAANSTCAYCTPAPTPFSIQSVGTGLSPVLNSNGTMRSIIPGTGLLGSLATNEILLTVGPDVMRTCNSSCLTNYIPSWNGACWTCIPATNVTQTYPVSVGTGVEVFQNSTLMTVKDLTSTGLVTLTDGNDINIDVRPLQAAVADSLTPGLVAFNGTSPAFYITTVSNQQVISETPHKGATFVSFPVIANLLSVSSTSIIWYHTRVNGGVGTMTGELMRTRITITMIIDTGGASGPFSFTVDDAGGTDHLGFNGAFIATWAGGPLGCRTTPGFVAPTGTADVTLASPANSFQVNGYAAIAGTFLCSLVLFRETLI